MIKVDLKYDNWGTDARTIRGAEYSGIDWENELAVVVRSPGAKRRFRLRVDRVVSIEVEGRKYRRDDTLHHRHQAYDIYCAVNGLRRDFAHVPTRFDHHMIGGPLGDASCACRKTAVDMLPRYPGPPQTTEVPRQSGRGASVKTRQRARTNGSAFMTILKIGSWVGIGYFVVEWFT